MATEGPLIHDGSQTVADASLTGAAAQQFLAVKATGSRTTGLAAAGGEAITGILQNTPSLGQAVDIGILGITKAQIGTGGVTADDQLMVEVTTSKLVTKTSTNVVVGIAIETAAAGTIGTVRLVAPAG